MTHNNLYRTLALAALTALPLAGLTACGGPQTQKDIKGAATIRWDAARVGVLYQLAMQQYTVGDYDKCRETLAEAFKSKTPSAPLHILASRVELENGSLELANSHLKTAVQIDGNNAEAYYLLGVVYQRWQNIQAAHDYYDLAFQKSPTEALYLLAVVEMKISLGRNDDAEKLLEEKLVYFEQSSAMRVALAKLATLKGDRDKASKYLLEATLLAPENLTVRENYAEALYYASRFADAAPVLEDLHNNAEFKEKGNVTMLLGQCYMNLRRPRDARTCFSELTRENPNNNIAWLNLGRSCIQMDDAAQAAQTAQRVLKTEPENLEALILLGLSQQQLKQWSQAETTLARAAKLAPADSTILCMQGIDAQKLGHKDVAIARFARAVEVNPTDTWAQELLGAARPESAPAPLSAPAPAATPVIAPPAAITPAPETTATPESPATQPAGDAPADVPANLPRVPQPDAENTVA